LERMFSVSTAAMALNSTGCGMCIIPIKPRSDGDVVADIKLVGALVPSVVHEKSNRTLR
jgi:hypothetical protein